MGIGTEVINTRTRWIKGIGDGCIIGAVFWEGHIGKCISSCD